MGDSYDVIMAAYPSTGSAQHDFDALVKLVKDKTVASEGVILVSRDAGGQVKVTQTGDHLGRKGLGWGGGVGLVVGLFSPPLLASVVVGGAVGGLAGKFAKHKVDSGIEKGLGDKLAPVPRPSSRWSTAMTGWPPSWRLPGRWRSRSLGWARQVCGS